MDFVFGTVPVIHLGFGTILMAYIIILSLTQIVSIFNSKFKCVIACRSYFYDLILIKGIIISEMTVTHALLTVIALLSLITDIPYIYMYKRGPSTTIQKAVLVSPTINNRAYLTQYVINIKYFFTNDSFKINEMTLQILFK